MRNKKLSPLAQAEFFLKIFSLNHNTGSLIHTAIPPYPGYSSKHKELLLPQTVTHNPRLRIPAASHLLPAPAP